MKDGEGSKDPVTPEKQKASQDPTPRKDKLSMVEWEQQTNARKHIREQMRKEMLNCSVGDFLADYSPFLPDDALVKAAKAALAERQLLVVDEEGQLMWQDFDEEPCRGPSEMRVFKPLEAIVSVFDSKLEGLDGRQQHFFYRDCPYTEVKSEIAGCNFKLDACFIGNPNHAENYYVICSEIAVVAEFKKFTKDFEDNREQLVSAASHIMNDDPCRKWMYGITVENTEMAIWYFSRSHSVKSATFNFTTDPETLIRVFLSFIYATREEMGYDPTVHRIEDNGLRYVYEIPMEGETRYFKTIDLLSHRRVLCITGRKTRVWSAVEVNGFTGNALNEKVYGDRQVALKDVWLDEGSKTEKENLDAIFERLSTIKEEAYQWAPQSLHARLKAACDKEGYKEYFMEIICDSFNFGRSKETSGRAAPAPGILKLSGKDPVSEDENMLAGSTQKAKYSDMPRGNSDMSHLKTPLAIKARSYKVKQQYRLVYKEVGESLDLVETLRTAFTALVDAYIAIVLMYLAGWVHRDISAGNIIAVTRSGGRVGGKLSDLEYAKCCDDESGSSDPKTGTAFFMPIEIHLGKAYSLAYSTPPPKLLADSDDEDPDEDERPANQNFFLKGPQQLPQLPQPQLRYRSQHGAESIWWVALYLLAYRVDNKDGEGFANLIFTHTSIPTLARQQLFERRGAVLAELQQHLHPNLRLPAIMEYMNAIPPVIFDTYFLDQPVNPEAMGKLYRDVYRYLVKVVLAVKTVRDVTLRTPQHVQQKKRARSKTPRKPADTDDYKGEEGNEESSSDVATRKRKKKANTGANVCR